MCLERLFQGQEATTAEDVELYNRFVRSEFKRRQEPPALIVSEYALGHDVCVEFNDSMLLKFKPKP